MRLLLEVSKGDGVPFGTRLCPQSLVCYTFMEMTDDNNRKALPDTAASCYCFSARKVAPAGQPQEANDQGRRWNTRLPWSRHRNEGISGKENQNLSS